MMNPVAKARKAKNLTVNQLATLAGISAPRIRQIERGESQKLTGGVLEALEKIGYDSKVISEQYEQWRIEQVQRVLNWIEENKANNAAI